MDKNTFENSAEEIMPDPKDKIKYNAWVETMRRRDIELEKNKYLVKDSDIEGRGWYAKKSFNSGEVISHYLVGKYEELRSSEDIEEGSDFEKVAVQCGITAEGDGIYIAVPDHPRRYINHSCEPNVGIVRRPRPEGGWDSDLVATKQVLEGDEIVLDYSTTQLEEWTMSNCRCGAKSCRHEITDFARLVPDLQDQYIKQGIIPEWMSLAVGAKQEGFVSGEKLVEVIRVLTDSATQINRLQEEAENALRSRDTETYLTKLEEKGRVLFALPDEVKPLLDGLEDDQIKKIMYGLSVFANRAKTYLEEKNDFLRGAMLTSLLVLKGSKIGDPNQLEVFIASLK